MEKEKASDSENVEVSEYMLELTKDPGKPGLTGSKVDLGRSVLDVL